MSTRRPAPLTALLTTLLLVALLPTPAAADERRPLTVEDLWAMQRVGSPALSPDGSRVVFTLSTYSMDDNKGDTNLWMVPTSGGEPRQLTWNKGSDSSPAWSPDGTHIAFVSKRGDGPSQLYLLPLSGGEARPVTELPVGVSNPRWLKDGKRVAFLASIWTDLGTDWEATEKRVKERKDDKVGVKISDNRLVRYWDHYVSDTTPHVFTVDVESGEVVDLLDGFDGLMPFWGASGSWDISPDGSELAFTANNTEPPYRKLNFDIWTLDLRGKDAKPVNITADNPAGDGSPRYTADGRYLIYTRDLRPEIAPEFSRFARYDRKAKKTSDITKDWDGQPGGWSLTPDGKTLVFSATDSGRNNVYSLPVAGGTPKLEVRGGTAGGVDTGQDGVFVFTLESITSPAELMIGKVGSKNTRALTKVNAERVAGIDMGTVEDVTFKGADGDDVQMWVVLPPGFDPKKKWPLVHMVHGGPHGSWTDRFHYRWNAALFAAPGYVVTGINFHGSTGRGQAFAESILGNHADKPFEDIMKGTDHMIATGYIDENRMGAAGGSYGGYMVSWILGHTDRFKALVNHAGVYDLMGQFASDFTWGRSNNYGASPWTDPERIDRYSPSRFAKDFNTPTLIIHGEKDYRVPYTQGLNLHGVLTGKGVPSRLVVYPKENHWILRPQGAVIWWREVHGWFDKYLGAGVK
ncbi:hypothetical protein ABI59_16190 [Acidobacteria bacterium Mor1]|nr:hypothetical protein ABI59_16190 [Acidobacteria bacterium Mor1]